MRGSPSGSRSGAGLTSVPNARLPNLPSLRGSVLRGEAAARRASLVSGPFRTTPAAYLVPSDAEELARVIRWSWEEGVPIIPRGGGTGMPGGNLGRHVVVELGPAFASVGPVSPEGRIRVGAGAVAAELEAAARAAGFFVPFLPSSGRWCRIGGMVANNAAGARSFRLGAAAASVASIEGIFAWGEPFRTGEGLPIPEPFEALLEALRERAEGRMAEWPRLRKNASGYALDRYLPAGDPAQLLVGSEGTLAVITGVELRLAPVPARRGLAILPVGSSEELTGLAVGAEALGTITCEFLGNRLMEMARLGDDPVVGELARGAYALVLLEVAGGRETVERELASVQQLGAEIGGRGFASLDPEAVERLWSLRHAASPMIAREAGRGRISTQFIEDSVVPPPALGAYLEGLDTLLREHRFDAVVFGHAGDGNVHVNPLVDVRAPDWEARVRRVLDEVATLVASLGGTLTGEHGDGRLRAPFLPRIWPAPFVDAFQTVRQALDPRGTLNPGVILPLPDQDPLEGFVPRPRSYP